MAQGPKPKAVAGVSEELPFFILFLFYFSGAIMGLGPKPTVAAGVSQLKNSAAMERENEAEKEKTQKDLV